MPPQVLQNFVATTWQPMNLIMERINYCIIGEEICPDTGREHNQCYFELDGPMAFKDVKLMLGKSAHIELRYGTQKQAIDYCKKDGNYTETGTPDPSGAGSERRCQGDRSDLTAIYHALHTYTIYQVSLQHPSQFMRYGRAFRDVRRMAHDEKHRHAHRTLQVFFLFGPTDSGKTRFSYDNTPPGDLYKVNVGSPNKTHWFNDYDYETTLLIDELFPGCDISFLLKALDRYPLQLETKGSFVHAAWTTVYMTSEFTTTQLGFTKSILRRITEIIEYTGDSTKPMKRAPPPTPISDQRNVESQPPQQQIRYD